MESPCHGKTKSAPRGIGEAGKEARPHDGGGNAEDKERQHEVGVRISPLHEERGEAGGNDHARHDDHGIVGNGDAEDIDPRIIGAEERIQKVGNHKPSHDKISLLYHARKRKVNRKRLTCKTFLSRNAL